MSNHRLFNGEHAKTTYEHTERLQALLSSDPDALRPSQRDLIELWQVFESSESYVGVPPTLRDFCHWVLGSHNNGKGCEVTW